MVDPNSMRDPDPQMKAILSKNDEARGRKEPESDNQPDQKQQEKKEQNEQKRQVKPRNQKDRAKDLINLAKKGTEAANNKQSNSKQSTSSNRSDEALKQSDIAVISSVLGRDSDFADAVNKLVKGIADMLRNSDDVVIMDDEPDEEPQSFGLQDDLEEQKEELSGADVSNESPDEIKSKVSSILDKS